MNSQLIAQLIAALPDQVIQQALTIKQSGGGGSPGGAGDLLSGLGQDDPNNKPQSWKDLTLESDFGKDRPPLSDKDFLVQKQMATLDGPRTAGPQDDASGAYDSPGGF